MAVGKGSMARASKAVKKAAEPVEEVKQVVVEEVPEIKEEKKPTVKKRAVKKNEKAEDIQKDETLNEMIAIGEEMPVYYL
ncbi:MAG: hypothetical protein IKW08_02685 [Roseburia sp.]|nr:hypothetical protein [Roseburia sp.]